MTTRRKAWHGGPSCLAAGDFIDLATEPLPGCDGFTCYQDERVHVMTRRVRAADLIAVCFPVYNYQPNCAH